MAHVEPARPPKHRPPVPRRNGTTVNNVYVPQMLTRANVEQQPGPSRATSTTQEGWYNDMMEIIVHTMQNLVQHTLNVDNNVIHQNQATKIEVVAFDEEVNDPLTFMSYYEEVCYSNNWHSYRLKKLSY